VEWSASKEGGGEGAERIEKRGRLQEGGGAQDEDTRQGEGRKDEVEGKEEERKVPFRGGGGGVKGDRGGGKEKARSKDRIWFRAVRKNNEAVKNGVDERMGEIEKRSEIGARDRDIRTVGEALKC